MALQHPRTPAINHRMTMPNDTLLASILNWIDIGRLNPGDVIDKQSLVEEFGVSRPPVREALLQPEAMGLIRRLPRKEAPMQRHIHFDQITAKDLLAAIAFGSKLLCVCGTLHPQGLPGR